MAETPSQAKIEELAKQLYELSRRRVSGRPSWDRLNPNDAYDMGMRDHALASAKAALTQPGTAQ